jgi:hypothetical protein
MRLYRELLQRMSHNSAVLAEFDNAVRGCNILVAGPGSKLQEAVVVASAGRLHHYCSAAARPPA